MADGAIAHAVTQSLSQYLITRQSPTTVYDARLENLLGLIEAEFSEPYLSEMFWRFRDNPAKAIEVDTFRLHLAARLERSPDFRKQVESALGGHMTGRRRRGRRLLTAAMVTIAALALVGGVGLSRAKQNDPRAASVSPTPPSPTEPTTTPQATTSTVVSTTSTTATSSTAPSTASAPVIPGDGGALEKGKLVYLITLPRPNNDWDFKYGEHDVQFTQYANSLWYPLESCNSRKSATQQFRLKNFSRFEVKAVGMDSTSDTNVAVRFEIFANDDDVNPIAAQVVGAGDTKELKVDLPPNVFALTLRVAFDQVTASPCRRATAVWGSPYVVAAGR